MSFARLIVAAAAVSAMAGSASAFVPWTNASGTATYFDWDQGGSDNGLFGSPILVGGDTFVFFPQNFRAQALAGQTSIVGDRLQFEIYAHAGFSFTQIAVTEYGDYGIVGTGQVAAGGTLFATNLDTANTVFNDLVTTPGSPILSGMGNWQGSAGVDTGGAQRLRITLNNNLFAYSLDGISWIEKKVFGSAVGIQILPAPGALSLAGLAGLVSFRRRR